MAEQTTATSAAERGPRRIRLSRMKGSRLPRGVVSIATSSRWGNPFKPGEPNGIGWGDVRDNEHAAALFARWLYLDHELVIYKRERHAWMLANLADLRGKTLACWCPLDAPCHGAILLIIANSTTFTTRHDHIKKPADGEPDARAALAALLKVAAAAKNGREVSRMKVERCPSCGGVIRQTGECDCSD